MDNETVTRPVRVNRTPRSKYNYTKRRSYTRNKAVDEKKEMFLFRVYVSLFLVLAVFCVTKIDTSVTKDITLRIKEAMSVQMSVETLKNIGKSAAESLPDNIIHGENLGEDTIGESSIPDNEIINEGKDIKN